MDDLISRQSVDDAIYEYSRSCDVNYAQIMEYIECIPSVKPKMGHWELDEHLDKIGMIYKYMCSECGANHRAMYDYCPSCGSYNGGDADASSD